MCKKDYIGNPPTCTSENTKYSGSIIDDSVITRDEVLEETKTISIKSTLIKSAPIKTISAKSNQKNLYILLEFLLIFKVLLAAVIIYFY